MSLFLRFFFLCLLLISVDAWAAESCPSSPNCPGNPCSTLGESRLADNQVSIVACLKTSEAVNTLIWKSMTTSPTSSLNIVKVTTALCKWGGTYSIIAQCPDGYELLGCGGGEGDLLESAENWFIDPDYQGRRCVASISQPACNGTGDQAYAIASCYLP